MLCNNTIMSLQCAFHSVDASFFTQAKIQLSNAEKELLQQLSELQISVDDLTCWKEEIIHVAEGEILQKF